MCIRDRKKLKDGPLPVCELYERVKSLLPEATDFLSVMDCLYALHAVDINDADEVFQCLLK